MKALFIGRFQPFHSGHLEVIKELHPKCSSLTIVIGSAQESHTLDNPFTAGERFRMIQRTLLDANIAGVDLIPVVDINRYAIWVEHVKAFVPPFDTVITNNLLTQRLFKEKGYATMSTKVYDRDRLKGDEIRRRIIQNESWQDLVPKGVVKVIEEIEGTERIRSIASKPSGEKDA